MKEVNTEKHSTKPVPFAESEIWDLQREYFDTMGFEAWRSGEVPHYVTTNPRHANAYAELVFALYKDFVQNEGSSDIAPIHIIELGAGSGRMAYYFLKRLEKLCEWESVPLTAFRYILTDFTQKNVDFWKVHPRFKPYFEAGILNVARFDATNPSTINLQLRPKKISTDSLASPIAVIANYLFDTIPQDLYYFGENGPQAAFVNLHWQNNVVPNTAAEKLEKVELKYALDSVQPKRKLPKYFREIHSNYVDSNAQGFMLFPEIGIACLDYLIKLSKVGGILLSADKGGHLMDDVFHSYPPQLAAHGSFSLNVNYHAISTYCGGLGGRFCFPEYPYQGVNTGCFLLLKAGETFRGLWAAANKFFAETGPDIYYSVYRSFRRNINHFQLSELISALRLGLYDSHQLAIYAEQLHKLLPKANPNEKIELLDVFLRCWDNYFALAEDRDLAMILGRFCYEMDEYEAAIFYFSQSTDIYGPYCGTFYNIGVCHYMLGNIAVAISILEQVRVHDPGNAAAAQVLSECHAALNTNSVAI